MMASGGNFGIGGHMGASAPQSSSSSQFKRYNLVDVFDDQYGHVQRNELLEKQKKDGRDQAMSISSQNK